MSELTPFQELINRTGTSHPQQQLLNVLLRVEKLEETGCKPVNIQVVSKELVPITEAVKMTRSEKMKAAWARRKAKCA